MKLSSLLSSFMTKTRAVHGPYAVQPGTGRRAVAKAKRLAHARIMEALQQVEMALRPDGIVLTMPPVDPADLELEGPLHFSISGAFLQHLELGAEGQENVPVTIALARPSLSLNIQSSGSGTTWLERRVMVLDELLLEGRQFVQWGGLVLRMGSLALPVEDVLDSPLYEALEHHPGYEWDPDHEVLPGSYLTASATLYLDTAHGLGVSVPRRSEGPLLELAEAACSVPEVPWELVGDECVQVHNRDRKELSWHMHWSCTLPKCPSPRCTGLRAKGHATAAARVGAPGRAPVLPEPGSSTEEYSRRQE